MHVASTFYFRHSAFFFHDGQLDDAALFAVQSLVSETFVLTASFTVYFLAPVPGGEMVATGRVVHQSKRLFLAESVIEVDGRTVARGNGSLMRSTVRLDESIGYR